MPAPTTRLPMYVTIEKTRHGKKAVYFRRDRGRRIRMPDDIRTPEFRAAYEVALKRDPHFDADDFESPSLRYRHEESSRTIKTAFKSAKRRADRKGVPFDLDLPFLIDMVHRQKHRCALTGIYFYAKMPCRSNVHPATPSIDRIEPKLGYVKGNIRLVIYAMNAMLLDWGEDVFVKIADSYMHKSRRQK